MYIQTPQDRTRAIFVKPPNIVQRVISHKTPVDL